MPQAQIAFKRPITAIGKSMEVLVCITLMVVKV
jgi:hypothetical protein